MKGMEGAKERKRGEKQGVKVVSTRKSRRRGITQIIDKTDRKRRKVGLEGVYIEKSGSRTGRKSNDNGDKDAERQRINPRSSPIAQVERHG